MSDWAEGSGSTWESLDGDPRIVAGAEVLVGVRNAHGFRACEHGTRQRVLRAADSSTGPRRVILDRYADESWPCRDLVVLRTADGELTEEGRALENLRGQLGLFPYMWPARILPPVGEWLVRAGVYRWEGDWLHIDQRRLAMALGREGEPRSGVERQCPGDWTDEAERYDGARPASPPPAPEPWTPLCAECGIQPARGGFRPSSLYCADCAQMIDDRGPRDGGAIPVDLSGEHHLSALRAWQWRPMGTR